MSRVSSRLLQMGSAALLTLALALSVCSGLALAAPYAHSLSPVKILGSHRLSPHPLNPLSPAVNSAPAPCSGCGTPPLRSSGGPIQPDPRVYLVFWGPNWAHDTNGVSSTVVDLFGHLAGGRYNNILSQYTDNNASPANLVHNDTVLAGYTFDLSALPSSPLSAQLIANEAQQAINNNSWTTDFNTQVLIFPQHDSAGYDTTFSLKNACGKHFVGSSSQGILIFGVVLYLPDIPNCAFGGGIAEDTARTASHEYAEMATDPEPDIQPAWVTSDGAEVGDLCNYSTQPYFPVNTLDEEYVTYLWSNADNGCVVLRTGSDEYPSLDTVGRFHGMHTVQGPIFTEYTNLGGYTGKLGDPMTEQMPLAGGQVSYFANNVCSGGYVIPANTGYGGSGLTSGSAIYFSGSTGAHEVQGCIYYKYTHDLGGPGGCLGFPTTDEYDPNVSAGDRESDFQHGYIFWQKSTGALSYACYGTNATRLNLYGIDRANTGSGTTEMHLLAGTAFFHSFLLHTPTALGQTGTDGSWAFLLGPYNGDGQPDLWAIWKANTGSGFVEVHILSAASNYQTFLLHIATPIPQTAPDESWTFLLGDYNGDGHPDLWAIMKANTGTGTTEVHILNGADNFQTFLLHTGTALGQTGTDSSWAFLLGDYNGDGHLDLWVIQKANTGSGMTEVHVLDGATTFQTYLLHAATALGSTGTDEDWEFALG